MLLELRMHYLDFCPIKVKLSEGKLRIQLLLEVKTFMLTLMKARVQMHWPSDDSCSPCTLEVGTVIPSSASQSAHQLMEDQRDRRQAWAFIGV